MHDDTQVRDWIKGQVNRWHSRSRDAVLLGLVGSAFGRGVRPPPPPPPPVLMPDFSFGPAFGSKIYGYLGARATAVKITVESAS